MEEQNEMLTSKIETDRNVDGQTDRNRQINGRYRCLPECLPSPAAWK